MSPSILNAKYYARFDLLLPGLGRPREASHVKLALPMLRIRQYNM